MQRDGTIIHTTIISFGTRSGRRTGTYNNGTDLCVEFDDGWYQYYSGIIEAYDAGMVKYTFLQTRRTNLIPLRGSSPIYRHHGLSRSEKIEAIVGKYHRLCLEAQLDQQFSDEEKRLWHQFVLLSEHFSDS